MRVGLVYPRLRQYANQTADDANRGSPGRRTGKSRSEPSCRDDWPKARNGQCPDAGKQTCATAEHCTDAGADGRRRFCVAGILTTDPRIAVRSCGVAAVPVTRNDADMVPRYARAFEFAHHLNSIVVTVVEVHDCACGHLPILHLSGLAAI